MSNNVNKALDRIYKAYASGCTLAVLMDYDGTLVSFHEHPRLAVLNSETRELLRSIATHPRVRFGILSGRSLDDLKKVVGVDDLIYVGTGGLEYEAFGERIVHGATPETEKLLARVNDKLNRVVTQFPGAWLETKSLGTTFHYRGVTANKKPDVPIQVFSALSKFGIDLRVTSGAMAIEAVPNLGWTKGTAITWLCKRLGERAIPLYAGDHANDAEAVAATKALGGVTIGVGPSSPRSAEHRLSSSATFLVFLKRLSHFLSKSA